MAPNILDFLLERVQAALPDVDINTSTFANQFTRPVREYFGLDVPQADIRAIIRARLQEEFPDIAESAMEDIFARQAALLGLPIWAEIQGALSRRRLDDPTVLSYNDLEESRDVYLTDVSGGAFSSGTFRAYFTAPRNLVVDTTTRIQLPSNGTSAARSYRPTSQLNVSTAQMRLSKDGNRYYVDVPVVASEPGVQYDLEPGEGRGATGIPGAIVVNNVGRISGGQDADDTTAYLARIRSSVRNRSAASFGGMTYMLQTLGLSRFTLVQTGHPLMTRDRIYGPTHISGILGGFKADYAQVADPVLTGSISLGVAFDVWIGSTQGQQVNTVRVSALRDEGIILTAGDIGSFPYSGGVPLTVHPVTGDPLGGDYVIQARSKSFGLLIADPTLYRPPFTRYSFSMYPIEAGDVIEREGWVDEYTGIRSRMVITSLGTGILTGGRQTIVHLDATDEPNVDEGLFRWQALRINAQWWDADRKKYAASILPHTSVPCFAIPLVRRRALGPTGAVLRVGAFPALTKPGTSSAETIGSAYVPRTRNVIELETPLPIAWLDRCELMDSLTQQPFPSGQRAYVYPAHPLFAEFLESRHGSAAVTGSTPVRVRFHLLGPQAMAPSPQLTLGVEGYDPDDIGGVPDGYDHVGSLAEYQASYPGDPVVGRDAWRRFGPYKPLFWPETSYESTPLDPLASESGRLIFSTLGYNTLELVDFGGELLYTDEGTRIPQVGDWVIMIPTTGTYAYVDPDGGAITDPAAWPDPYVLPPMYDTVPSPVDWYKICRAFPILEIEDDETVIVHAADIPSGEIGRAWIVQGTSRAVQLSQGRGPEGTYYTDIFCARWVDDSLAEPDTVEHPPYGTPVQLDLAELYMQGFNLYSATPGIFYSNQDEATLLFPTSYVNDGEELDGRTIQVYGPNGNEIETTQTAIDDEAVRPMATQGLVKHNPPVRVVLAVHYDAADLTAEDAAQTLADAFIAAQASGRIEVSDLIAALYDAGADYVSSGRAFVLAQDNLRKISWSSSRGAIHISQLGDLVPSAIDVRKLDRTARALAYQTGATFVDEDSGNWSESYTYRYGDYDED